MLTTKELAEKTSDAYSFDRYNSWEACVKKLRANGLNDREIEAVLRSKWTRWAADGSKNVYGKASSNDLMNYINKYENKASIEKLTKETFEMIGEE
mgnify:CR=1 FL=1